MRIFDPTPQSIRFHSPRVPLSVGTGRLLGVLPVVLAIAFIWPFGGGTKVPMMAGSETPAAQGTVIVKGGNNGNTALDIKVQALAAPSSLSPAENAYVVWIQPPDHSAQNLGQISVGNNESGELHTETPFKRFQIFITAEQNAQTHMPMGPKILSADISHQ